MVAALAYGALLSVCFIGMRVAGVSWPEVGIRALTLRSLLLGSVAGILLVTPVWRLPAVSIPSAAWLVLVVAVEEVVFRGVLFAMLRRAGGLPVAIGGSTVVFTLAHAGSGGWPSLVLVALAGLYLGVLRAIRGDLWAAGMAHLAMDFVSMP